MIERRRISTKNLDYQYRARIDFRTPAERYNFMFPNFATLVREIEGLLSILASIRSSVISRLYLKARRRIFSSSLENATPLASAFRDARHRLGRRQRFNSIEPRFKSSSSTAGTRPRVRSTNAS